MATNQAAALLLPDTTTLTSDGISVQIIVGGAAAPIFASEKKGNENSGFIISVEGTQFMVKLTDARAVIEPKFSMELFCDGESMQNFTSSKSRSASFEGKRIGPTSRVPYMFSNIVLSDEVSLCNSNPALLNNLGTISVRIWRVTQTPISTSSFNEPLNFHAGRRGSNRQSFRKVTNPFDATPIASTSASTSQNNSLVAAPTPSAFSKIINERTKKALFSHTTGFGEAIPTRPSNPTSSKPPTFVTTRMDPKGKPWLIFTFKYRSKELLELQSIIPSEPTATQAKVERLGEKREIIMIDDDEEVASPSHLRIKNEIVAPKEGVKVEKGNKKSRVIILSDSD